MQRCPVRYFLFLSLCGMGLSCSQYTHMKTADNDLDCVRKFTPVFNHAIYRTSVDIVGKHISGLLVVKFMPDSSTRFVFSNEMGFSFFDLGFLPQNQFKVYSIMPQMNRKSVIKTLRKDFGLIMFRNMDAKSYFSLKDSGEIYHGFKQSKGVNYYVTDSACHQLIKMQRASNRKAVVEAVMDTHPDREPDSILIRHLNFNFTISLKKIPSVVAE
jgi:hypothetical protein